MSARSPRLDSGVSFPSPAPNHVIPSEARNLSCFSSPHLPNPSQRLMPAIRKYHLPFPQDQVHSIPCIPRLTPILGDLRTAPAISEGPPSKLVESSDIRPTRKEWAFLFLCLLIPGGKKEKDMIISMKLHATRDEIDEVCGIVSILDIRSIRLKARSVSSSVSSASAMSPLAWNRWRPCRRLRMRAHFRPIQVRQQGISQRQNTHQGEWRGNRRRRICRDGRPLFGGE